MQIEKSSKTGFCFGVRRAIDILEKEARERGTIEALGEVVHNEAVMRQLAASGVRIVSGIENIKGNAVCLSAHGVSPSVYDAVKTKGIETIDTTCPIVQRAQKSAKQLNDSGFFVIVFGDADHPEVKGILGWADNRGMAVTDINQIKDFENLPSHLGVLSQTTQIQANFLEFTKELLNTAYRENSEIRIIDTLCPDLKSRQSAALDLAKRVDVMVVVGGRNSANTRHLAELCATATETYKIAAADELTNGWFKGKGKVGIAAGTSTADNTIQEVIDRLNNL